MKFNIKYTDIFSLDISWLEPHLGFKHSRFLNPPGQAYFKTLAYFSTLFDNVILIDLGTRAGASAVALSYNPSNTVSSFDIEDKLKAKIERPNIRFHVDNILLSPEKLSVLLDSQLIYLDIDPHDGIQEKVVSDFLLVNNYKGVMLCDDIKVPQKYPGLHDWFNTLPVPFYDISKLGTERYGFGLVDFGYNEWEFTW